MIVVSIPYSATASIMRQMRKIGDTCRWEAIQGFCTELCSLHLSDCSLAGAGYRIANFPVPSGGTRETCAWGMKSPGREILSGRNLTVARSRFSQLKFRQQNLYLCPNACQKLTLNSVYNRHRRATVKVGYRCVCACSRDPT